MENFRKYHTVLWIILIVIVIVFLSGCSTITVFKKKGIELLNAGDYDKAVEYFEKALKTHPRNSELRTFLFKAKLKSYYYHLALARKWRDAGKKEEAIREYRIVLGIFPGNKSVNDELDGYLDVKKEKKVHFKSHIKPPVRLDVDTTEKISLNLRSAPIIQIFKSLGKSYNVNFIFDKDFRDFVYTMEIENIGFYDILNQLCLIGNAKYRVLDSSSILIYPNTSFKVRSFSLRGVKVFYLSNIKAEDCKKLVMTLFRDQQIQVQEDTNLNSLIIKGSSNALREIEQFIRSVDKEKGEVEIDVEILELNRKLIQSIGIDYGDTLSTVSAGRVDSEGNTATTVKFSHLEDVSFFITIPSAALNFLETDTSSRIIAKPNLRGIDGEEIKFMVGDEVPIPQIQLHQQAAGGVASIPVTSYTYKSVGVEVKLTPFIHRNQEVTVKIKLSMNFITGYIDNFPTVGKRELENIIRLKEGETTIIGGFIRDELRGGVKGMPGLSKIPILGKLFGSTSKGIDQTDLVFSITPRIIRKVDIADEDLEAIWTNTQSDKSLRTPPQVRPGERPLRQQTRNSVIISPRKRRVKENSVSYFTLRVNSTSEISSLSISGSISGAKVEIEELKTDFFSGKDNAKVLRNISGDSFDLGYTFETIPIKNNVVAQLKVKFLEKGSYTLSLNSINAYSKDRKQIDLAASSAEIEVY